MTDKDSVCIEMAMVAAQSGAIIEAVVFTDPYPKVRLDGIGLEIQFEHADDMGDFCDTLESHSVAITNYDDPDDHSAADIDDDDEELAGPLKARTWTLYCDLSFEVHAVDRDFPMPDKGKEVVAQIEQFLKTLDIKELDFSVEDVVQDSGQ